MVRFIKENIRENLWSWGVQKFLRAQSLKCEGQNDKLDFMKIENSYSSKVTFMEMKIDALSLELSICKTTSVKVSVQNILKNKQTSKTLQLNSKENLILK